MKIKKEHYVLLGVLIGGCILRMAYLYFFKDSAFFNPFFMDKHDQKTFILWAEQTIRNPWYVDGEAFYMAPLYAYFLAGLYYILRGSLLAVSIIQLIMDVVICSFLYYVGKKIYNEWAGIVAAFLGCFYMTSIIYAATILSDGLIYFLYMFFIALVYFALQKPSFARWIYAGIVLGLAALAKPTIAVYLPFLFFGLYFYPSRQLLPVNAGRRVQPLIILSILLVVSGITILPITVRNYFMSGEFVPICTNGPINWKIGNSSDSLGLFHYPEGELLSPFSRDFWRLFLMKVNLFFTSYEWPQNLNVYLMEEIIPALKIAFIRFGFVVPVGVAGFFLLFKDWRRNFIFITFTASNVLWVVLFFITDRYRLPAVGCFSICAGYLIVWSFDKIKRHKSLLPVFFWLFAALFAYFYNIKPGPLIPEFSYESFSAFSIRNIQHEVLNDKISEAHKKAITYFEFAPGDYRSNFMLALTFAGKGDIERSEFFLNRTLEINPGFDSAREMLEDVNP